MPTQDYKGQNVTPLYGTHFMQTINGNTFIGNQLPAGAAPALWSATTQQCGILNAAGSGVFVVPIRVTATYVSGTGIVDGLCLSYVPNAGPIATGSPAVTAATTIAPVSGRINGPASRVTFMSAGITTAAPTRLMNLGLQTEVGATLAAVAGTTLRYDFDGSLAIPPGYAVFVAADITGITAVYSFTIIWAEIPVFVADLDW
jgi:hypothetical protein